MPGHDIIVVGASAGGVETLARLVKGLPSDLPAAIFIVLHIPAQSTSILPQILNRHGSLKATHPADGQAIQLGQIYVAPPNHHLLVKGGYIRLTRGPSENGHRPAVDPLFRTAAQAYGQRVVVVVLSGNLDDGTAGLLAVKQRGGIAVVQDPNEAMFPGMPSSAVENVGVDHILPVSEIASLLVRLAQEPVEEVVEDSPVSEDMATESSMAELDMAALQKEERPGTPSGFACPECGGALWELSQNQLIRFRCRTGHAFSAETLLAEQTENLETALWIALRALEERGALAHRMAHRARQRNHIHSAVRYEQQAQEAKDQAATVRGVLLDGNGSAEISTSEVQENSGLSQNPQIVHDLENQNGSTHHPDATADQNSPSFTVVAIAASAGGLNALTQVLSALPQDFPAAITIVQHIARQHPSFLADILGRQTSLSVKQAQDGDSLQPGGVYIAPPNKHLLVNPDGTLSLSNAQMVHFSRPSADLLFESVAASFQKRVIGVVLTGKGCDGANGIKAIKKMGGTTLAQDQASSESFGMPEAAINTGLVDFILPLNEIASVLVNLMKKTEPLV